MYDEHYALALADERGLRVTILRLFNAYGPRNHLSWWGGPVVTFVESLLDGEPMEIHGDGLQTRTFTYVDRHGRRDRAGARAARVARRGRSTSAEPRRVTILELAAARPGEARPTAEPAAGAASSATSRCPGKYQDVIAPRARHDEGGGDCSGSRLRSASTRASTLTIAWHREQRERGVAAEA